MPRLLTPDERRLAWSVFGPALHSERVKLHRGGFGRLAVTVGSRIFLPPELACPDFACAPLPMQGLLVHEMVHVWQFQTRPLRTLASWACTVMTGGYGRGLPAYRYRLPIDDFARLGLERQASAVEHAFLIGHGVRPSSAPAGAVMADFHLLPFPLGT